MKFPALRNTARGKYRVFKLDFDALTMRRAVEGHHFLQQHGEPTLMIISHSNKSSVKQRLTVIASFI